MIKNKKTVTILSLLFAVLLIVPIVPSSTKFFSSMDGKDYIENPLTRDAVDIYNVESVNLKYCQEESGSTIGDLVSDDDETYSIERDDITNQLFNNFDANGEPREPEYNVFITDGSSPTEISEGTDWWKQIDNSIHYMYKAGGGNSITSYESLTMEWDVPISDYDANPDHAINLDLDITWSYSVRIIWFLTSSATIYIFDKTGGREAIWSGGDSIPRTYLTTRGTSPSLNLLYKDDPGNHYLLDDGKIRLQFVCNSPAFVAFPFNLPAFIYSHIDQINAEVTYQPKAIADFQFAEGILNGNDDYYLYFQGKTETGTAVLTVNENEEIEIGPEGVTVGERYEYRIKNVNSISIETRDAEGLEIDYLYLEEPSSEIDIITPEKNTDDIYDSMRGYYLSSDGFDGDVNGNPPQGFLVYDGIINTDLVNVIEEKNGHNKVLDLYTVAGTDCGAIWQPIPSLTTGSIELYVSSTSNSSFDYICLNGISTSSGESVVSIRIAFGYSSYLGGMAIWYYVNDGETLYKISNFSPNEWYHLKISWDCGSNWYCEVLDPDGRFIGGDGGSGYQYDIVVSEMNKYYVLRAPITGAGEHVYVDAIDCSWKDGYYDGRNLYNGFLLEFESQIPLEWSVYILDGNDVTQCEDITLIPFLEQGHHTIQVLGSDSSGAIHSSIVRTFYIPPIETILLGSTNRFFPHVDIARLGYTFTSMDDFKYFHYIDPMISFSITETENYIGNVDIKLFIDKEEIWSTSVDIDGSIIFSDINAVKIIEPYLVSHQIIVEVSNGAAGPNDIYRLNYLKVQDVECKENEAEYNKRFAPVETNVHGYEHDNAIISVNTRVPYNQEDGIVHDHSLIFSSSTLFMIDPDTNGPDEYVINEATPFYYYYSVNRYYLHSATVSIKIIDPEGEYVDNGMILNVFPSIAQEEEYDEMNHIFKKVADTLYLIVEDFVPYAAYILFPFDLTLIFLPSGTPPSTSIWNDGNTANAKWADGEEQTLFGPMPINYFNEFSMNVPFTLDLPIEDASKFGCYQIEQTWSYEIYTYHYTESWYSGGVRSYLRSVDYAFTMTETSFVNFIYDPTY